ncbi:tRNA pseudouridine(55) synthase TruB [Atopococcus tabaci]|uniref:tRNA pseudouridine(55) synthase TruB n=1 Tax=Atopococcus tabaci TaxID=269774 RepID=UPI0004103B64|nr:tRNA pseudouridine(55) synthase TruB [Atopococcus tabaci]
MEGILPLWKERGMTSHDCVMKARKILKTKKIGHTGTLDPDVDGVLPLCIGKATKVIEYLMESGKEYMGEITLGISTTTEDKSGEIVEQKPVPQLDEAAIDEAMNQMTGDIVQIPPMYSAVKVNGRRLYDYARQGETVERPKRQAHIESFERTSEPTYDFETQTLSWRFRVLCGKGTYVRTLAVDTGKLLGYPAHMSDLTRTGSGGFKAEECVTLEQVAKHAEAQTVEEILLSIERALTAFPRFELSEDLWLRVKDGALLHQTELDYSGPYPVVFYKEKTAVGIYQEHPSKEGVIKPMKMLRNSL